jgi:PIN domain-containing protein
MDLILDSNVFLNDLKFESPQFGELLAYLRRTGNKLIIPNMVMLEVLERYKDRLQKGLDRAKGSWVSFAEIRMLPHPDFPHINFEQELLKLGERMFNPGAGVQTLKYSDVSDIDVNEIARRGAKRLRPANQNGEELRDVILWLSVVQYARKTGLEVAFISGDHGFRQTDDTNDLHSELAEEIASAKLPIHFYRDISAFLTSNSLSQEPIAGAWLPKYVNSKYLADEIKKAISGTETNQGLPSEVSIEKLEFSGGTSYQISAESHYVELKYIGRAKLTFRSPLSGKLSELAVGPEELTTIRAAIRTVHQWREVLDWGIVANPLTLRQEKTFDFQANISTRIERDQQLVHWQVDQVQLTEASE